MSVILYMFWIYIKRNMSSFRLCLCVLERLTIWNFLLETKKIFMLIHFHNSTWHFFTEWYVFYIYTVFLEKYINVITVFYFTMWHAIGYHLSSMLICFRKGACMTSCTCVYTTLCQSLRNWHNVELKKRLRRTRTTRPCAYSGHSNVKTFDLVTVILNEYFLWKQSFKNLYFCMGL